MITFSILKFTLLLFAIIEMIYLFITITFKVLLSIDDTYLNQFEEEEYYISSDPGDEIEHI